MRQWQKSLNLGGDRTRHLQIISTLPLSTEVPGETERCHGRFATVDPILPWVCSPSRLKNLIFASRGSFFTSANVHSFGVCRLSVAL